MNKINNESFEIIKSIKKSDMYIKVSYSKKKLTSKSLHLGSIEYNDSFCCLEYLGSNYTCKIKPKIRNIWIDANEMKILLEYGIIHGANGCDKGPFYKAIKTKEKCMANKMECN